MPSLPRAARRAPRPSFRRASHRAFVLPAALLLALTASACGGFGDDTSAPPADPPTGAATSAPATSGTPEASPTEDSPAPSEPAASGKPSDGPTRDPNRTLAPLPPQALLGRPARAHLLDASRMPTIADDQPWTRATKGDGGRPVGACQKASLFDIGAVRTTERSFATADGSATAVQVLGKFADRSSAYRAAEVLRAWRADCADRLEHPRVSVGEATDVPVRTGFGTVYAASYGPRKGDGRSTAVGIVRKGSWLSLVEVATDEDRWPAGRNPARQAVRRIAATFRG